MPTPSAAAATIELYVNSIGDVEQALAGEEDGARRLSHEGARV